MKIVVLAGGISTERDVSLSSGAMIYRALKKRGHQVILLDVYLGYEEEDSDRLFEKDEDWAKEISSVSETNPDIEQIKALRADGDKNFFGPGVIPLCQTADVVFLALHGENGENGKIQACFDLMGITYTGTDYVSSALCMDKELSKEIFACHGIPTPESFSLKKGERERNPASFPCIVKACCGGSSVGVSIAFQQEDYPKALAEAFAYDDRVIVEQYIKGREFSVGVIDGKALPVIEIAPLRGFYDYKNNIRQVPPLRPARLSFPRKKPEKCRAMRRKLFRHCALRIMPEWIL